MEDRTGIRTTIILILFAATIFAIICLARAQQANGAELQAAFGATTDQIYSTAKETTVALTGWITDHGRDRAKGYWFDVADYATYNTRDGRTVRIWHKGRFKPSNGCHVAVVGTVGDPGELTAVSTRIDEDAPKKPKDMRKK